MRIGMQTVQQLALSVMIITVLCICDVLSPRAATAATYYVATNGSDSNPCTQSSPCQTIAKGISNLASGDTLYLRQGNYGVLDTNTVCIPSGTSYTNAITIASYPGETATLSSVNLTGTDSGPCGALSYVIFDRITLDGGGTVKDGFTTLGGVTHIRFQNGEAKNFWSLAFALFWPGNSSYIEVVKTKIHDIHQLNANGGGYGFYIQAADNLVDGCEIYNNDGYAIQFYNGYTFSHVDRNIVRNNKMHDNGFVRGFGALTLNHGTDYQVYNNLIYNNFSGADVVRDTNNALIINNTLYNNRAFGIRLDLGTSHSTNSIVRNNILYNNGNSGLATINGVEVGNAPSYTADHNLTTDPKFVNAGANDFTLQSTSPALDAGITLSAVPTDFNGVPRPQGASYDIGAYEYRTSSQPPAPKNLKALSVAP
jgi:hypothetical protein